MLSRPYTAVKAIILGGRYPGTGDQPRRFNLPLFEQFLDHYRAAGRRIETYPIADGRERLCILRAGEFPKSNSIETSLF
jgi:hypothetical protein